MHGPTGIFWANLLVTPFSIKGKLNGTDVYVMSFDFRDPRTPTVGQLKPRPAALSHDLRSWRALDTSVYGMPPDVEHGDVALRFAEPYWYSITGREAPGAAFPGPDAEFITEIFRPNDLTTCRQLDGRDWDGQDSRQGWPAADRAQRHGRQADRSSYDTSKDVLGTPTSSTSSVTWCNSGGSATTATAPIWTSSSGTGGAKKRQRRP